MKLTSMILFLGLVSTSAMAFDSFEASRAYSFTPDRASEEHCRIGGFVGSFTFQKMTETTWRAFFSKAKASVYLNQEKGRRYTFVSQGERRIRSVLDFGTSEFSHEQGSGPSSFSCKGRFR